jgi:hypothetical protein
MTDVFAASFVHVIGRNVLGAIYEMTSRPGAR